MFALFLCFGALLCGKGSEYLGICRKLEVSETGTLNVDRCSAPP